MATMKFYGCASREDEMDIRDLIESGDRKLQDEAVKDMEDGEVDEEDSEEDDEDEEDDDEEPEEA